MDFTMAEDANLLVRERALYAVGVVAEVVLLVFFSVRAVVTGCFVISPSIWTGGLVLACKRTGCGWEVFGLEVLEVCLVSWKSVSFDGGCWA